MDNSTQPLDSSDDPVLDARIEKMISEQLDTRWAAIEARASAAVEPTTVSDRVTLVVFSGDMDKAMAAFIIATGAAAMGTEVSMFFTFWGLSAIKKQAAYQGKPIMAKMMAAMLPSGPNRLGTSKMNMLGLGPAFFKKAMRDKNVQSLPELIQLAQEMDVKMIGCEMSMDVMGIAREELLDGVEFGGVATYLEDACDSKVTLFI